MCSLAINFEIQLKGALETSSLLVVFMIVAIITITQRYRGIFRPLSDEKFNLDCSCVRTPIAVENEEINCKVNVPLKAA